MVVFALLLVSAIATWYVARVQPGTDEAPVKVDPVHRGFYLKSARILGTGPDGGLFVLLMSAAHTCNEVSECSTLRRSAAGFRR